MALPQPPFEGACLCGAIRVRVTAPPMLTLLCHCRDCQKLCASAYSITTMFASDSFSCEGDLIRGGLGTTGRAHYFCKSCLTLIYSRIAGAEHRINLRTSVLNDAGLFTPYVEVMTDEKLPWLRVSAKHSFCRYPAGPGEVQALMEGYAGT